MPVFGRLPVVPFLAVVLLLSTCLLANATADDVADEGHVRYGRAFSYELGNETNIYSSISHDSAYGPTPAVVSEVWLWRWFRRVTNENNMLELLGHMSVDISGGGGGEHALRPINGLRGEVYGARPKVTRGSCSLTGDANEIGGGENALQHRTQNTLMIKPTPQFFIASFLAMICGALANAGGVGGGGLFVPLFNLLLGFDAKTAVALSKSMILGGAIVSFLYNIRLRHPKYKERSLIDYNIAILLQPMILLGISIGVLCNVMFPSWLVVLLLVVLLTYVSFRSFRSGIRMWKKETAKAQRKSCAAVTQASSDSESAVNESDVETGAEKYTHDKQKANAENEAGDDETAVALGSANQKLHVEGTLTQALLPTAPKETMVRLKLPLNRLALLAIVWILFLGIQIVKEGNFCSGRDELISTCGVAYWSLTAGQIPLALIVTGWVISTLYAESCSCAARACQDIYEKARGKDVENGCDVDEPDVILGGRELFLFPLLSLVAGTMGGLLGIGGGMVICPLLLEIGFDPQVTASTGVFMVLFSSSMSVAEYSLLGRIPILYGLYFSTLCAIASWGGHAIISKVIKQWGRVSVIIFATAVVISVSVMIMGFFGAAEVYRMYMHGDYMGFSSICEI